MNWIANWIHTRSQMVQQECSSRRETCWADRLLFHRRRENHEELLCASHTANLTGDGTWVGSKVNFGYTILEEGNLATFLLEIIQYTFWMMQPLSNWSLTYLYVADIANNGITAKGETSQILPWCQLGNSEWNKLILLRNSKYSCIWCICPKSERHWPARTVVSIRQLLKIHHKSFHWNF